MKKQLLISSLFFSLYANDLNLYYGHIKYSDSIKDKANYFGLYSSYFKSPYKIELDIEHMQIDYKNTTPTYKQTDLTLFGHYYKGYNWDFRAGIHNIFIDQKSNPNNYDNIFGLGALYYKSYQYNFGTDIYYSNYDFFKVWQISPSIGFYFGDYKSKIGSFYLGSSLNYIHLTKKDKFSKKDYLNFDIKLENYNGNLTSTLFASVGKNAYKVANGGFSIYNLKEEYKYSYGAKLSYNLKKYGAVSVKYSKSKFIEDGVEAKSNNYTFGYVKHF